MQVREAPCAYCGTHEFPGEVLTADPVEYPRLDGDEYCSVGCKREAIRLAERVQ